MTDVECGWHNVPKGSYSLRCTNYGWFPTEVLMGTDERGRFADTCNIGANIGGNLGSASIAVLDLEKAIAVLSSSGYNVISKS